MYPLKKQNNNDKDKEDKMNILKGFCLLLVGHWLTKSVADKSHKENETYTELSTSIFTASVMSGTKLSLLACKTTERFFD